MRSAYFLLALALGAYAQQQQNQQQGQQQQGQQQQQQQQGQTQQSGSSQAPSETASTAPTTPSSTPAPGNPNAKPAEISQDNPIGNVFKAEMPEQNKSGIKGYVSGTANSNGTGVVWSVNIENLPKEGGPFAYHVHEKPLSADGDCKSAGAHLDPQGRGEDPPCDPKKGLKTCQVGDLSGKHGKMTEGPWQVFYLDLYTSTSAGTPNYVGGRSIVIHDKEKNRLTCANLTMIAAASDGACEGGNGGSSGESGQGSNNGASPTGKETSSKTTAKQAASTGSGAPIGTGAGASITAPVSIALGVAALVTALL